VLAGRLSAGPGFFFFCLKTVGIQSKFRAAGSRNLPVNRRFEYAGLWADLWGSRPAIASLKIKWATAERKERGSQGEGPIRTKQTGCLSGVKEHIFLSLGNNSITGLLERHRGVRCIFLPERGPIGWWTQDENQRAKGWGRSVIIITIDW
jgi:hypothetical protein